MKTSIYLLAAAASLASLSLSCQSVECGTGTVELDGVCVAGDPTVTPPCGPGTAFDSTTGQCIPKYCVDDAGPNAACGFCPEGANPVPNPTTGVIECIGGGTGRQCGLDKPVFCNAPDADKFMACGRIFDIETSQPLLEVEGVDIADLKVQFYNATAFATQPTRPEPLMTGTIDECGNFQSDSPTNGILNPPSFIAVALDDKLDSEDNFVLTGVGVPASTGAKGIVNAFITRRDTMNTWNAADVEVPDGDFEIGGVFLPIYVSTNAENKLPGFEFNGSDVGPIEGVTVTANGNTFPAFDFYFSDSDPKLRRTLSSSQNSTGPNGSAMFFAGLVAPHSGQGPAACNWSEALGGNVAGVVFVAERHSTSAGCE
jgi:hypothetical protein